MEDDESTRKRLERIQRQGHEDHIAEKAHNSLSHYNLAHKFILMSQAIQILEAKAAVDKEWEKLNKMAAWQLTKARSKKKSFRRHTKKERGFGRFVI